jgi:hypothetical protein
MACPVCCEELNRSTHNPCVCPKCEFTACKTCVRTYLESTPQEFHCMSCKFAWDDEFVLLSVNKTYFHSDLKEKRKQKYYEIEKSKLADSQVAAKNLLIKEECEKQIEALRLKNKEYKKLIQGNEQLIHDIEFNASHKIKKEVKAFIMRCQAQDCNGFVSKSYKCELCEKTTCSKCFEIVNEGHECNPGNVETAELIKKDSRPCPKCATRISKIDGCSQMWCTNCHTAFDWNTGQEVKGHNIHNPHYYDYLKTSGGGVMPRNPGDVLCGGLPRLDNINIGFIGMDQPTIAFIRTNIFNIHRMIGHIQHMTIPTNQGEFENNVESVRVLHILNRITDEEFKRKIYDIYAKKNKKGVNIRLLELVQTVGMDILQKYMKLYDTSILHTILLEKTQEVIHEFHAIIEYFNSLQGKKTLLFKETGLRFKIEESTRTNPVGKLFMYSLSGTP